MASKKQPSKSLKLYKVIFQCRYDPELAFYQTFTGTADKLDYPHWEIAWNQITLKDFDNHCSMSIRQNAFGYEQDSSDIELEKRRIREALETIPEGLKLQQYSRMGYRRRYLAPVRMTFEELARVFHTKFFNQSSRLEQVLPENLDDILYRVDVSEDDYTLFGFAISQLR